MFKYDRFQVVRGSRYRLTTGMLSGTTALLCTYVPIIFLVYQVFISVAPRTFLTYPIDRLLDPILFHFGLTDLYGSAFDPAVPPQACACLLAALVFSGYRTNFQAGGGRFTARSARLHGAAVVAAALYTADYIRLIVHRRPMNAGWAFAILLDFFVVVLFLKGRDAIKLINCFVFAAVVQACYAVSYYCQGINQFVTPDFGNRTTGTFDNPNLLYPVLIVSIPIALAFGASAGTRATKLWYSFASCVLMTALVLTFSRSGWIGCSASLLCVGVSIRASQRGRIVLVNALLAFSLLLFVGGLCFRTHGRIAGNSQDRSANGRRQIWQVAFHSIVRHPLIGTGSGTFGDDQAALMTRSLRAYHPFNQDADNLYLNVLAESGLVGFATFIGIVLSYMQMVACVIKPLNGSTDYRVQVSGINSGLLAILVAGIMNAPCLIVMQYPATLLLSLCGASASILCSVDREGKPMPPTIA